jgi:hypothetical protein
VTCLYTSGTNELLLPEGVTSVTVTAVGGRGGDYTGGETIKGGRGAEVTGTVAIPSETRTLYAVVGGNGADRMSESDRTGGAGGANGGGDGGTPGYEGDVLPGAGGGGASDVRTVSGELESRLVVAAGGGGSIYFQEGKGGDAGAPGEGSFNRRVAQAGTSTEGGGGGIFSPESELSGSDGVLGVGGAGGPVESIPTIGFGGGGGGGGLYGGGGGSTFGSGAGGSSLAPAGTTLALSDAAPSVTITYQPPTVTPPQPPVCTGSACLPTGLFGSS